MAPVANAQVDAIRRARAAVNDRLPSVASLFGTEPSLTTTINDAKDGVALLDDFKPAFFSPMLEMPRGDQGAILLAPGSYSMWVESFCLLPGTWGPHRGEGYLHTSWKGPKAELVSSILQRYPDHREVPREHAQKLLWSILSRAKFEQLDAGTKFAASRLLTPAQLADLNGWGLSAVNATLRDRVLAGLPPATRRVLEAENELRRLMTSAEVEYAELERVAVREGAMPAGEATFQIPEGRWSYHPSGFFIRYLPAKYTYMRVDVYMPDRIQLQRDASGRIISISAPDGRHLDLDETSGPSTEGNWGRGVHDFSVPRASASIRASRPAEAPASERSAVLLRAASPGGGSAHRDLLMLARMDVADLLSIRNRLRVARATESSRILAEQALHAALSRQYGIEHRQDIARSSALAATLRPVRLGADFAYDLVTVPDEATTPVQGRSLSPWRPGGGGGTGGGSRQRLGPSGSPHGTQRGLPGRQGTPPPPLPSGEPDALDRAQRVLDWFNKASDLFGALTDPAGFIGGQPQGQMLGAGMDAAFSASRQIGNSLSGQDDHAFALPRTEAAPFVLVRIAPASPNAMGFAPSGRMGRGWVAVTRQAQSSSQDYRVLARPVTITFPEVAPGPIAAAHARAVNATVGTTLRMAATLTAVATTRSRLAAAVAVLDREWEDRQARAMIYLKRLAGTEMVQLAHDLEALRLAAGTKPVITESEARNATRQVATSGWTPTALAVARELGLTDARLAERGRRWAELDPASTSRELPLMLEELANALSEYGSMLAQLPEMRAPWD